MSEVWTFPCPMTVAPPTLQGRPYFLTEALNRYPKQLCTKTFSLLITLGGNDTLLGRIP